jgi:hypothetical protein
MERARHEVCDGGGEGGVPTGAFATPPGFSDEAMGALGTECLRRAEVCAD